jgi:hypothetical protein
MSSLWYELEQFLDDVEKPARYIGGEDGTVDPDHSPEKASLHHLETVRAHTIENS